MRKRRKHRKCKVCSKPIDNKWGKKYCSNSCQGKERSERSVKEWLAGGSAVKGVMLLLRRAVRLHLIKEANGRCEVCGWDGTHPIDGRSLLHIHHIDGNAKNSKRENLSVLCPNCHAKTENFGARNTNSQRYRRVLVQVAPREKLRRGRRKTQRKS